MSDLVKRARDEEEYVDRGGLDPVKGLYKELADRIEKLEEEKGLISMEDEFYQDKSKILGAKLIFAEDAMLAAEKAMESCRLAFASADNVMTDTAKNILGNALRELSKLNIAMGDSEIGKQNRAEQRDERRTDKNTKFEKSTTEKH